MRFYSVAAALMALSCGSFSAAAVAAPSASGVRNARLAEEPITQTRPVSGECRGISLQTAATVVVRQGSPAALSISGPAAEVAQTETVVEKGILVIRQPKASKMLSFSKSAIVTITVTLPEVESLSLNSSGSIRGASALTGANLALSLAGSGSLQLEAVLSGAVTTSLAGSGEVMLSGKCEKNSVRVAGSGNVKASKLAAQDVTVAISGSGNVSVAAAKSLDVRISGSGNVRYAGTPATLVKRVTGSGSVKQL